MALFNSVQWNQAMFGGVTAPGGRIPVEVGQGILYPALRKAGITLGPQRTPSPAQFQDAIDELTRLIGMLNCDRLFIYSIMRQEFPLTPGKASYTIGQSRDPTFPADFDVPRPQLIENANVVWGSGSRDVLALPDAGEWSKMARLNVSGGVPRALYNDRAYPLSTLTFWPAPSNAQTLELFSWTQVPAFQSITDVVLLPLQYEDALTLNLAVRLAPHFQKVLDQNVREDARVSLMHLRSINAPQPIAALGFGCEGDYDVLSDTWR